MCKLNRKENVRGDGESKQDMYEYMGNLLRKFGLIIDICRQNGTSVLNRKIQSYYFDISRCNDLYLLGEEEAAFNCLEQILDDKTLQDFAYEIGDYIYKLTEQEIIPCIVNDENFADNVCGCDRCQQEADDE